MEPQPPMPGLGFALNALGAAAAPGPLADRYALSLAQLLPPEGLRYTLIANMM